jgi:hypothetical protein
LYHVQFAFQKWWEASQLFDGQGHFHLCWNGLHLTKLVDHVRVDVIAPPVTAGRRFPADIRQADRISAWLYFLLASRSGAWV